MTTLFELLFIGLLTSSIGYNSYTTNHDVTFIQESNVNHPTKESLFQLRIADGIVSISPPTSSDFYLPDSAIAVEVIKKLDFNGDGKEDLLVGLGACGTGGCMYGLFLQQKKHNYTLAFLDYLKNMEFHKEPKGHWSLLSYEEMEPMNPSKLRVNKYKYQATDKRYVLDTTYVTYDWEAETPPSN